MFNNKKFKSDYVSLFNNNQTEQTLPNGYPCTFNSDCSTPSVCQFNVCTENIQQSTNDLANICHGLTIKDCAKAIQKERESTEIPVYIPNSSIPSSGKCKYDKECSKSEVCITGTCIDKSNFPLIARQMRLKSQQNIYTINNVTKDFDTTKFFQHKKTPLDGQLSPYEYMFLLENNLKKDSIVQDVYDDYFYLKNN